MRGQSYTIAGGKGGVGKTTTAVNLATALQQGGHEVCVVDADLAMTNLGAVLGVDHEPTLHDVLSETAELSAAITHVDDLAVVPGDPRIDRYSVADPGNLRDVIARLETAFDVVLVDTGAGLSHESIVPFAATDGVVLVTTADDTAVTDATKTAEMVAEVGGSVEGVVATRATPDEGVGVADRMELDLLGTVPEATVVGNEPVVEEAPDSTVAAAYRDIAQTLASSTRRAAPAQSNAGASD